MLAKTQVLTFHGIGAPVQPVSEEEAQFFVPEEAYRQTIRLLSDMEQRHSARFDVTFDDGNLSDFTVGLPALVEAGRRGRFFVLAGRIGARGYLSESQMRDIDAAGSVIGTHGYDHVDWRTLDEAGFRRELFDARRRIEDVIGKPVTEAAIPFGAFDRQVLHRLKKAGYDRVYTSTPGLSYGGAWFCPRWSPTATFDPRRDLPPRLALKQKLRGTAYALARRFRYRI
ncbi:MAG: polysaccharide deacetylase family protein [Roseibium sp.]